MNSESPSPILTGVAVRCIQNAEGTYDGVIKTSNNNKYPFFNNAERVYLHTWYQFQVAVATTDATDEHDYDLMAIHLNPIQYTKVGTC